MSKQELDEWEMVSTKTGQVMSFSKYAKSHTGGWWERVYIEPLCELLEAIGGGQAKVFSFMLKNKDYQNRVIKTVRAIAEGAGVSKSTAAETMLILQKNNMVHKICNGVWRISPHIIRNGGSMAGSASAAFWDNENEAKDECHGA